MAKFFETTITADGDTIVPLRNIRDQRNIYTVQVSGTFGGGTVTAFTMPNATDDVPIEDSVSAISITSNDSFNFEANSDPVDPVKLKITVTGATTPSINLRVDNAA